MRILGIDPGTATTGFGVITSEGERLMWLDAGVVSTPSGQEMPQRLLTISQELGQLITESKPDLMAVELLFFATNVKTAISVGQARGVVLLAAAQSNLPVIEFTPLQVKQAVTGYGQAGKSQVQEMVKTILKLDQIPRPDDAADALAVAIAAAQANSLKTKLAAAS